jgi:hypothetical protein
MEVEFHHTLRQPHRAQQHRLFPTGCELDLESIIAKLNKGAYGEGWFKFRNPQDSQYEGRRLREAEPPRFERYYRSSSGCLALCRGLCQLPFRLEPVLLSRSLPGTTRFP